MLRSELISIAALVVSIVAAAVPLWYHCKRDNERFGRLMERLGMDE